MLQNVRDAFEQEKAYQEYNRMKCKVAVDGFTNFIFINRFGNLQHQGMLNKALFLIQQMEQIVCFYLLKRKSCKVLI